MLNANLNGRLDNVRYQIDSKLILKDSSRQVPIYDIDTIIINNSYDVNIMYNMVASIIINRNDYIAIQNSIKYINIIVKEVISNKDQKIIKRIFEGRFKIEELVVPDSDEYKNIDVSIEASEKDLNTSEKIKVNMQLINEDLIEKYKILSSNMYKDTNITNIIANELSIRGINADNKDNINLHFLPINLYGIMKLIDKEYGCYKDYPLKPYFGLDKLYILNPYNKVYTKGEIEVTNIVIDSYKHGAEEGSTKDTTSYVIRTIEVPEIIDLRYVKEVLNYNKVVQTKIKSNSEKVFKDINLDVSKAIYSNSKYVTNILERKIKENYVLSFNLSNIYYQSLNFNKTFNVYNNTGIVDDKGISIPLFTGTYRSHSNKYIFIKDAKDSYTLSANIELIKM